MFRNYFKTAWRNITKNRFYSIVNIMGLAVGIAFTLLIGAYVWSALQVNAHLKDADNQYIIQSKWKEPNMGFDITTLAPLAKTLRDQYPNLVANYYRFDGITSTVSRGNEHFHENLQLGDSTMLNMYGFSLMYGNPKTAFSDPFSVVINKDIAIKYFGKANVLGQTLTIENMSGEKHDFTISGVLNKLSKNSVTWFNDLNHNLLFLPVSSMNFFGRDMTQWSNKYILSYVELQNGVTAKDVQKVMKKIINSNTSPLIHNNLTPYLVPLKDYYLEADNGLIQKMIDTLSIIAIFILLMAVINFINLSVSSSGTRLKEIGIRKVLGGLKQQLIFQFLAESIVIVVLSTAFAVIIYMLTRNYFSSLLGATIPQLSDFPIYFVLLPLAFAIIIGLFAGIYPAFVLSSLKPEESLKGKLNSIKEKIGLRKLLIGFQFCVAAIVFIGAIIVSEQISFFFSKNIGYNKDYIVSAQVPRDWSQAGVNHMEAIRQQFEAMPQVKDVSLSYEIPNGNSNGFNNKMSLLGKNPSQGITTQSLIVDKNFASTYQIPLAAGHFFIFHKEAYDSTSIVINEASTTALGLTPSQAIGNKVKIEGLPTTFTITGVTKDFHFNSMQQAIKPIWFANVKNRNIYRYLSFKLKPGNISGDLAALQKKWSALMPGAPFEYQFMDETLKNVYATELQLKKAAYTATILAFIIVLLGVIGIISLSIQKRTKEIGIRKVLGSSVAGIITLFLNEFLLVIFIASIPACALAYMIMHYWLNGYAYKIAITAKPFFISILLLAIVTILLIIIQTINAANTNPVKSLRSE